MKLLAKEEAIVFLPHAASIAAQLLGSHKGSPVVQIQDFPA
jgi:hypothetical protein